MRDFGYYSALASNVYTRMNGEINTTIMANQLVIEKLKPDVMGRSIFMGIFINLVDLYDICYKMDLPDDEVSGAVIFTLLHELSHCDQERDPLRAMRDNNYRLYIEYTNNLNVMNFLTRNMKDMFSIFGYFKIPEWMLTSFHTVEFEACKGKNVEFVQSKSFKDSLIYALSGSCYANFHQIIRETGIEDIAISLNVMNTKQLELEIIKNGRVKLCKSEMIYLENLFANSKFTYTTSLKVDDKKRIMININSNETPKFKVVDFK